MPEKLSPFAFGDNLIRACPALTYLPAWGKLNSPKHKRRHRRLGAAPQRKKYGSSVSASNTARESAARCASYWRNNVQYPRGLAASCVPGSVVPPFCAGAEQRPVSARTGGLSLAGERCSAPAFFLLRKIPNHKRYPVSESSILPLLEMESELSPLPDRLRLLAECVEDGRTPYNKAVAALLMESAERIDKQLELLRGHCRQTPHQFAQEARHA